LRAAARPERGKSALQLKCAGRGCNRDLAPRRAPARYAAPIVKTLSAASEAAAGALVRPAVSAPGHVTPATARTGAGAHATAARRVPINETALLLTLAGIQFTHIVDFMVMMPLGPQFTRLFAISDAQFGLLVSAYTLAAGASGLLWSLVVDRFERRKLLLGLYVAFALATLACGLAPTYGTLMTARVFAGVFGGAMGALVMTIVGDAIPFERRGRAMGIVMASFSLATVAGVPASLFIADALGWHASFIAIALASFAIAAVGLRTLPRIDGHLHAARQGSLWAGLAQVVRERNHWRAFGFSALIMAAGFTTIPFLTIFMTSNTGLSLSQVPLVYLVGGVATLVSSRLIGVAADRWGKVRTFRAVALAAMVPVVGITYLGQTPVWIVLTLTTAFFVLVSGRMIPGMALITAAAIPSLRGTFMSLNSAVQAVAMGIASLVGGLLIGRDAQGLVQGYEHAGWLAVVLTVGAVWWVGRLRVMTAPAH
jgi:predicted MFS family arabinose efflux permease